MKKVLAFLLVGMLVFGSMAFASYTETLATAGMPAVLSGIDQIMATYPSKIMDFKNLAVVEYGYSLWGYTLLDTDLGVIGVAASPVPPIGLYVPDMDSPDYILTLMYGTDLGGINLGVSLFYGSDSYTYEELDPDPANIGKDVFTNSESYLAALLGLSLDVGMPLDVSIGIALPGNGQEIKDYNDVATSILVFNDKLDVGGLLLNINARTILSDWILNLGVSINSLNHARTIKFDGNADGDFADAGVDMDIKDEYSDAAMNIGLLVGKQLKATETMIFTIGVGLNYSTSQDTKYKFTDNLVPANNSQLNLDFNTNTSIEIPFYMSVNCKINETWSFMAGVNRTMLSFRVNEDTDYDADGDKTDLDKETNINTDYYMSAAFGLTGQFGDLKLQWYMDPSLLLNGPYFISGSGSGWSSNVAIVYDWK